MTFKNKKGSSLTIFYLLAVMIVYKTCININKNKKKRKGKETIKMKAKKKAFIGVHKGSWLKKHSQKEALFVIAVRQLGT